VAAKSDIDQRHELKPREARTIRGERDPSVKKRVLEPIPRVPLTESVIHRLRDLVRSDRYEPGDKLPSERVLREELGVGRSTIREALRALEALGLIELRQGSGAFVRATEGEPTSDPPFADWWDRYAWRIEDAVELRLAIESEAAALAALRRRASDLEAMFAQLDAFDQGLANGELSTMVLADVALHEAIAVAANPLIASILRSMSVPGVRSRRTSLARSDRQRSVSTRHRAIVMAIEAGDPWLAARTMELHLIDFASELGVEVPAHRLSAIGDHQFADSGSATPDL
jgi:GntR family transcriptional regulator, transcriptional repressor for pyruvate dehydrogenase complex